MCAAASRYASFAELRAYIASLHVANTDSFGLSLGDIDAAAKHDGNALIAAGSLSRIVCLTGNWRIPSSLQEYFSKARCVLSLGMRWLCVIDFPISRCCLPGTNFIRDMYDAAWQNSPSTRRAGSCYVARAEWHVSMTASSMIFLSAVNQCHEMRGSLDIISTITVPTQMLISGGKCHRKYREAGLAVCASAIDGVTSSVVRNMINKGVLPCRRLLPVAS